MGISEPPIAELKAGLFKSLAHPIRIRILEQLAGGEKNVGQLVELLSVEISHLSQQLAVLRRSAIVSTRREGNTIFYQLADPQFSELLTVAKLLLLNQLAQSEELLSSLKTTLANSS